jgi:hypothetical protein
MAAEKANEVRVEHVVNSLYQIEIWCRALRKVVALLGETTPIQGGMEYLGPQGGGLQVPKQLGGCPPPPNEEGGGSGRRARAGASRPRAVRK